MYHSTSVMSGTTSWFHEQIETCLRRCFEQVLAETTPEPSGGRPPEVGELSLWMAVIVVLLRGLRSQRAIWRLLVGGGLWHEPCYDVSDQAIYNRLDRQGSGPLPAFFARLTELLLIWLQPALEAHARLVEELAPFACEVVALDESTLDAVSRRLPTLRKVPAGDERLLPGKLVAVFDLRRQLWRAISYVEQVQENEKRHARDMLAFIAKGALILMDLGYFSFEWFDELSRQGYSWISRLREQTTAVVMHTYFDDGQSWDKLVWMGIWDTQAAYMVRMVQITHAGIGYRYITNVLDPKLLSLQQIAQLYARRWDIERAFLALKQWLGIHLLWSSKPQVILAQVWACAILAQVIQAIRVQVAALAEVEIFDVSLPLLMEYMSQWNGPAEEGWRRCVEQGRRLGTIRPSSRLQVHVPQVPLSAYRAVPLGRTLVRPGLYPDTQRDWEEADEESQRLREAISQRTREVQAAKRARKKQQAREEEAQIKAEVTKAIKAKKQQAKAEAAQRKAQQSQQAKAKQARETRSKQEQAKWNQYWQQPPPPGAEAPPWQFYVPWYEEKELSSSR